MFIDINTIPHGAKLIINQLNKHGYKAYLVGGCVRDSIMGLKPHDWDICTSAKPEQVMPLFSHVLPTGIKHGTVTVETMTEHYEVTTFRIDGNYSDGRRPDDVEFTSEIVQDLSRRDFTINAIALDISTGSLIDPFNGYSDINSKLIKCVGNPNHRFKEDGLRILRAIRFAAKYEFYIESDTINAMVSNKNNLKNISNERICSEITKILQSRHPDYIMNYPPKILCEIVPEFIPTVDYNQHSIWHNRTLYNHMSFALSAAGDLYDQGENYDLITNLAIMFHDISKPECKTEDEEGHYHFKGHGKISAETTEKILKRLRFDNKTITEVVQLIYYHDSTIDVTKKSIKRWLNKLGLVQFKRLLNVRICDIIAQNPDYLVKRYEKVENIKQLTQKIIEENNCFTIKDLAINGKDIIETGIKEGKKIGIILNQLLDIVIEDPTKNKDYILLRYVEDWKTNTINIDKSH